MISFIIYLWNTVVFEPLFNLIALLMAFIPGHNFGIALIAFTLLTRVALYPWTKKQLLGIKKQKSLQPEVDKIKKAFKNDRRQQSLEILALYKRNKFSPFAMLGNLLVQFPVLIALYQIISRIAVDSQSLVQDTYAFVQKSAWVKDLYANPDIFDPTLFGLVDLTRSAISDQPFYFAAFLVAAAAAFSQFLISKQSMARSSQSQKNLRQVFKEISAGGEPDSGEVNAAASRLLIYFIPILLLVFLPRWSAAISFYVLLSALAQYFQQKRVNSQKDSETVKVSVDGQDDVATMSKPLNAKQKKQKAAGRSGSRRRAKRVAATARTVGRKKE